MKSAISAMPCFGEKPRHQDVRFWQIELLAVFSVQLRLYAEKTAFLRVQQRGKNRRRIESREAEEVDGAVRSYQGNRSHVANDAVIFDWLKVHERLLRLDVSDLACMANSPSASGHAARDISILRQEAHEPTPGQVRDTILFRITSLAADCLGRQIPTARGASPSWRAILWRSSRLRASGPASRSPL